jgi:Peptidase family M28
MKTTLLPACLFAAATVGAAAQSPDLRSEGRSWWAHIQFLADDGLEGRNVGTPGYDKAVEYVERQFRAVGLKPAGTNGFRQPVRLDSRRLVPDQSRLALVRDGQEEPLVIGQDASLSARGELDGSIEAPLVFVGYGLSIPEAGWDDFAGVDLRGKIAVYVNAFPPVRVSDNVKSHVNTADERWLALKRAGAIGVATIAAPRPPATPNPAPATPAAAGTTGTAPGRGRGGAAGGGGRGGGTPAPVISLFDRELNDAAGEIVSISFTQRGAATILAGSGHTLDEIGQLLAANKPLPRFPLPGTLKAHAALARDTIESTNVAGVFEGSDPALASEYVIMSAHLDHVGIGRAVDGDTIYNGAMDDASGIAAVIETARLLNASGVRTKRSVLFLAVTAEEKGLLGSRYFAGRPTVPFRQIVADINLDMFLPLYPLKVIEVQGLAESSLGESVRAAAKTLGVDVQTDREPEQNRFIRSDQYSFIRKGVPALAFKFGYEFGSPEETIRRDWVRDVYHKPSDDIKQPVNLEAAALFNRVIMTLLQRVANDAARPTWHADSFFRRFALPR